MRAITKKRMKSKTLFCDALTVYEKLIQKDLVAQNACVVTRSFELARQLKGECVYIDANLSVGQRQHFKMGIVDVERQLIKKLDASRFSEAIKIIFLQLLMSSKMIS